MKIIIRNNTDLLKYMRKFDVKPASSIQTLILAILNRGYLDKVDCTIKVPADMLKLSYHAVPAMLARSIMGRNPYPWLQSFLRGEYMIVAGGYSKVSMSFKSKALDGIRSHRQFAAARDLIPMSYRRRPSILSAVLSQITGLQVCNRCKSTMIIWFVPK